MLVVTHQIKRIILFLQMSKIRKVTFEITCSYIVLQQCSVYSCMFLRTSEGLISSVEFQLNSKTGKTTRIEAD